MWRFSFLFFSLSLRSIYHFPACDGCEPIVPPSGKQWKCSLTLTEHWSALLYNISSVSWLNLGECGVLISMGPGISHGT